MKAIDDVIRDIERGPEDSEYSLSGMEARIIAALDVAGYVIVPKVPTDEMQAAAYYAGHVGDNGGAERESFDVEYGAAVEQFTTGKEPSGLLALVRPW